MSPLMPKEAITAAASTLGGKYLNECNFGVTVEPCVMCGAIVSSRWEVLCLVLKMRNVDISVMPLRHCIRKQFQVLGEKEFFWQMNLI